MSSIYNAQGGVPAPTSGAFQRYFISSSTNTAPIQVTFSAPTGIADQDTIEVEAHDTNTAANGVWQATKITSSVYALNGSTGNGVGGATGYAIDYAVTPLITVVGDGDLINAANINPAIEGTNNLGPFLYRRAGKYRLYNHYDADFGAVSLTAYSTTTTANVAGVFQVATGLGGLLNFNAFPGSGYATQAGDILEYSLSAIGLSTSSGFGCYVDVGISLNGGAYAPSGNGPSFVYNTGTGIQIFQPVNLIGSISMSANDSFDFAVLVAPTTASHNGIQFNTLGHLVVRHYRLN